MWVSALPEFSRPLTQGSDLLPMSQISNSCVIRRHLRLRSGFRNLDEGQGISIVPEKVFCSMAELSAQNMLGYLILLRL